MAGRRIGPQPKIRLRNKKKLSIRSRDEVAELSGGNVRGRGGEKRARRGTVDGEMAAVGDGAGASAAWEGRSGLDEGWPRRHPQHG